MPHDAPDDAPDAAPPRRGRARPRPVRRRPRRASRPTASAAPSCRRRSATPSCSTSSSPTDIDADGNPVGQGNVFPEGTDADLRPARLELRAGGHGAPAPPVPGRPLRLRDEPTSWSTRRARGSDSAGFVFPFNVTSGFPAGDYYDRGGLQPRPGRDRPVHRGRAATRFDAVLGAGLGQRPDPLQEPRPTSSSSPGPRSCAPELGSRADEVARGGGPRGRPPRPRRRRRHPRHARTPPPRRSSASCGQRPVQVPAHRGQRRRGPLLPRREPAGRVRERARSPTGSSRRTGWPRTTSTPTSTPTSTASRTCPIARIPSSDDADLLLTQLGEIIPPDGGALRPDQPGAQEPGRRGARRDRERRPGPPAVRAAGRRRGASATTPTPRTRATCTSCSTGSAC